MRLKDRIALITGGARGIGLAIARAFVREGASIALCDINATELDHAVSEFQGMEGRALAFPMDVTRKARVQEVVGQVLDRFGKIDILVNNAGIYEILPLEKISEEQWDRVLGVNLKGVFLCTQAVMGPMKNQGQGRIINMASSAGKTGGVLSGAHYAVSKAGIICLTKSVAREVAPYGVTVNAIAPGRIDTLMIQVASEEENQALEEQIPLRRVGRPEDVASAAVFLASEEASYITGEILDVNGGLLMD